MSDMTPPTPQEIGPSDADELLWESVVQEGPRCAECGTELFPHEAARTDAGKFSECCDDCVKLKLGLR